MNTDNADWKFFDYRALSVYQRNSVAGKQAIRKRAR